MRNLVLPTVSISVLALSATMSLAADLPSRRAPPVYAPPPPIPVFTWTGLYGGINAGAAFDRGRNSSYYFSRGSIRNSSGTAGTLTLGDNNNNVGFAGGGQIGYNYQLGSGIGGVGSIFGGNSGIVVGAVADAQYLSPESIGNNGYSFTPNSQLTYGNAFVPGTGLPRTVVVTSRERTNFFGTARGRLGVTFDRVLVYGTGGFAYNTRATGYTYGGGLEYAITNNVTVGAEFLHVNLDRGLGTTAYYAPGTINKAGTVYLNSRGGRDNFNVARAVLNYKLDMFAPIAPVVARY